MSVPKRKDPFKLSANEEAGVSAFLSGRGDDESKALAGKVLPEIEKLMEGLAGTKQLSMKQINKIIEKRRDEQQRIYLKSTYKRSRSTLVAAVKRELDLINLLEKLSDQQLKNLKAVKSNYENHEMMASFYASRDNIITEMRVLAYKLMQQPSASSNKDINLLFTVATALSKFIDTPNPSKMRSLINSSNQLFIKMGPVWNAFKTALVATIGLTAILVGTLGLGSTFGASVSLIALGASLCAAAGLSQFKLFKPKITASKNISKDVKDLLEQTDKILRSQPNPEIQEEKQSEPELPRSLALSRS